MTLPEVYRQFRYWGKHPPTHELASIATQAFTNWRPVSAIKASSPEEMHRAHMDSLKRRWDQGALNIKQLYELAGGGSPGKPGEARAFGPL